MSLLKSHPILSSQDLSQLREQLSAGNSIKRIDVLGRGAEIDVAIHGVSFQDISLAHFAYGSAPTRFEASEGPEALQLIVTTSGGGVATHRQNRFEMTPARGFMRNMTHAHVSTLQDISAVALTVSAQRLRQHLHTLVGAEIAEGGLVFDGNFDMATPASAHLLETLSYVARTVDGPLRDLNNAVLLKSLSDLVLTSMLCNVPHSHSDLVNGRSSGRIVPYYVKRARDYIHAHAAEPISLEVLVAYAGCSYRTLQHAFRETYGISPMTYLRSVRLSRAHDELRLGDGSASVRDIALRWGFTHMGWFSRCYLEQFGVLPSQTRRARG